MLQFVNQSLFLVKFLLDLGHLEGYFINLPEVVAREILGPLYEVIELSNNPCCFFILLLFHQAKHFRLTVNQLLLKLASFELQSICLLNLYSSIIKFRGYLVKFRNLSLCIFLLNCHGLCSLLVIRHDLQKSQSVLFFFAFINESK